MKLDKIYESLGIDKLDEEKQKELKEYLDETVELKAKEIAEEKINEEKDKLIEQYEEKFEDYKEDITTKFSDFVDDIMEKELQIPDKIKEYARIGERYQPVLEKLETMLGIDKGSFDDKAKEILGESKSEIKKLRDKVNDLTSAKMELEEDAKEMATHIYLRKKCDGMLEAKRDKIISLLEDAKSKDEIDRKFKILSEQYESLNEETMYCKECDAEVEVNEEDDKATCPDCGGKLVASKESDKGKTNEQLETDDKKTTTYEDNDIRTQWLKMIRENSAY